jgi:hypothetical protein
MIRGIHKIRIEENFQNRTLFPEFFFSEDCNPRTKNLDRNNYKNCFSCDDLSLFRKAGYII